MTTTLDDVLRQQSQQSILQAPTAKTDSIATTSSTIKFTLTNNTDSSSCWAFITGLDPAQSNSVFLLQSDGVTAYYPTSPSSTLSALAADCAIPLGAPGASVTVTVPYLNGGRVWLSRDAKLTFLLNPGPALVEPSVTNTGDANYDLHWSFVEFTYNSTQLFANVTYVDFVSLPISLSLENTSGAVQTVQGIPSGGLDSVVSLLQEQDDSDGAGWSKLIVKDSSGSTIRALSPNSGIVMDSSLFSGYYQSYVDQVWSKYESSTLTVDCQDSYGKVTGQVSDGALSFSGVGTWSKPSAADIFSCSTGPFANSSNTEVNDITTRLTAAFNRSTLLINSDQPDGETVANYYTDPTTNHYARIVHSVIPDGKGYAFPYDDVDSSSATSVAGTVSDGSPQVLTLTFGGISSTDSTAAAAATSTNTSTVVTRVPVGQLARSGGAHRQLVGGRIARRDLSAVPGPPTTPPALPSADQEKAALAARDDDDDDDATMAADLEKGLLLAAAPARSGAIAAAVRAFARRVPVARRAAPVLEALARAAVDALRVSVGTVVGRAVVVAALVLGSFVLGFFWPDGRQAVHAVAADVL